MNKVTKEAIEAKIKNVVYHLIGEKTTICVITMNNGFEVMGESSCVDVKNFDFQIGKRISYENAFDKLWPLEGYLLQEKLKTEREKVNPAKEKYPLTPDRAFKADGSFLENRVKELEEAKINEGKFLYPEKNNKVSIYEGESSEKVFDWNHFTGKIEDPEFKQIVFYKLFPGVTENDFKKLENRQAITDELSFMEKAETLEIENLQGAISHDEKMIRYNKLYRQELDLIIQSLKGSVRKSPERSTAIRKITEGVMWLGMDLKAIGTPNPYPESKNPNNTVVEKTADGLKL